MKQVTFLALLLAMAPSSIVAIAHAEEANRAGQATARNALINGQVP